jgi:putative inorganic carbon (HCO3(-)) transporter
MRDYFLTLFVFAMVPVCVARPWIGILMWYWLGLMNPHRLTWDFAYTMPFAMAIGLATLFGALFARDRRPIPWQREMVLLVILFAYFCFTTLFAWVPSFAWIALEKLAKIVFMTFVATMFIYGKQRIRALMLVMVFSIGYYGIKGGVWSIMTGGAEQVLGPEGSFIEGNTFIALALNMVIPVMVALAQDEAKRWLRYVLYGSAGLCVIGSFFTYSRGGWLGLAVILSLMLLHVRWKARFVLVFLMLVVGIGAHSLLPEKVFTRADTIENYEEDCSANQRLMAWTVNWNVAKTYPLTGAGFSFEETGDPRWLTFGDEKYMACFGDAPSSSAHSIYFQMMGQHGFVAFFLYVLLLVLIQLKLTRLRREAKQRPGLEWVGWYAGGVQIGLFGYLISGAFLSSAYFDLAWLYFALTCVLARELSAVPAPVPSASATTAMRGVKLGRIA